MSEIHSFDVFDTCLVRNVAAPSEVFFNLGLQVGEKAKISDPRHFAEDFATWRMEAEARAFKNTSRVEVTLEEIWIQLHPMLPLHLR